MTIEELSEVTEVNRAFASMPNSARIWVYKSPRAFSTAEQELIRSRGNEFVQSWVAHQEKLDAALEIPYNHFIVLAVNEEVAEASGCSIDSSMAFIKSLEQELNLTLTDRMLLVYEYNNRVSCCKLSQLSDLISSGELAEDALIFDDLVRTKGEFDSQFRKPLGESWAAKFT